MDTHRSENPINADKNPKFQSVDGNPEMRLVMLLKRNCQENECVMTTSMASCLKQYLPVPYRFASSWSLVYSDSQYGFSLATLYIHSAKAGPVMLVIRESVGNVFGAFCSERIGPRTGHFGSGECFLWKMNGEGVIVYRSTGQNPYYLISDPNFLAIGCGNGRFGLSLDRDLLRGESHPVSTFGNEILSTTSEFTCVGVELWSFDIV